jgi:acyl-CoA thioesterase-1
MTEQRRKHFAWWLLVCVWMFCCGPTSRATPNGQRKARQGGAVFYLAVGDSTAVGFGSINNNGYVERLFSRIVKIRPHSRMTKICSLGETTGSLREKLVGGLNIRPTLITVSIGTNDLLQGVSEERFEENYESIIKVLGRLKAPIIVTNLPDVLRTPALSNSERTDVQERLLLFNRRIKSIATKYKLSLVDLDRMISHLTPSPNKFFSSDGFHPSDMGYDSWARMMWPPIRRMI